MPWRLFLPVLALAALAGGCAKYYTQQADRDVYRLIDGKNDEAFGRRRLFNIDPDPEIRKMFAEAEKKAQTPGAVQPEKGEEAPEESFSSAKLPPALPEPSPEALRLTMADAFRIAVHTSREYQAEKERAYLAALALTFERYLFQPHPTWTGTVNFSDNNTGADTPERARQWNFASDVGVSQKLADGALIVGDLGMTALKLLNKEVGDHVDSALNFTIDQPLWRGAGRKIVQENLLQAERNALYAVRGFARFEQAFAVTIATQYLGVLQQRDIVLNQWRNYQSLVETRERAEWLAKAERLPEFQVDQARQDELRAYNSWIVAREAYENALDSFKLALGLPLVTEIALEPKELERLSAAGVEALKLGAETAVAQALKGRLDLLNARGGVEDTQRKVVVAEDGLNGDVDLVASLGYTSLSNLGGPPQSARLLLHRGNYAVGLKIDMPIDRLTERNALRTAQIVGEAAWRAMTLLEDTVVLEVRQAVRAVQLARETYENQRRSVALAERRVESTQLLLQAGRATQRDVLEAQSALVDAQNGLVRALVDHTLSGLELQRDVGTLAVDEKGQIRGWVLSEP